MPPLPRTKAYLDENEARTRREHLGAKDTQAEYEKFFNRSQDKSSPLVTLLLTIGSIWFLFYLANNFTLVRRASPAPLEETSQTRPAPTSINTTEYIDVTE